MFECLKKFKQSKNDEKSAEDLPEENYQNPKTPYIKIFIEFIIYQFNNI